MVFNGVSNVSIAAYPQINFTGQSDYTFATWIHPTAGGNIFNKGLGTWQDKETVISLDYDSAKQDIVLGLDDYNYHGGGTGWQRFGGNNSNVLLNQWTHIAIVKSGNQLTMYKNGVLDLANSGTLNIAHFNSTASMGGATIGSNFNGGIDEFTIWNKALDSSSIANLMNDQFLVSDPNLVGYFPFSEGLGTATANKSMVGNSGTLSSDAIWGTGKR